MGVTELRLILIGVAGVALIAAVLGFIHHIRVLEDHKWQMAESKAVLVETQRRGRQLQHDNTAKQEAVNGLKESNSKLVTALNNSVPASWLLHANRQVDAARASAAGAGGVPPGSTDSGNVAGVCSGGSDAADLWPRMQLLAVVGGILATNYARVIKFADDAADPQLPPRHLAFPLSYGPCQCVCFTGQSGLRQTVVERPPVS